MFPPPDEVLKSPEGNLADTPLPLLLHALLQKERTCTLSLSSKGIEKHLQIEEGLPVACHSNLLHETLGRFLVERGKVTDEQYNIAYAEVMRTGADMGGLLVSKGIISASDLYKQLQANLARKILDCFRWADARYKLNERAELGDALVKMNAVQLILTGCSTYLPFDVVATQLVFTDEQPFGLAPNPPHALEDLRLSAKDSKLLNVLRQRPTFGKVLERTGLETEEAFRKLYALSILGWVQFAQEGAPATTVQSAAPVQTVQEPPPQPSSPPPPVPPGPVAVAAVAVKPDETPEFKDSLTQAFMDIRGKDPFVLLGVPEDVQPAPLRKAFLALADRFSPARCVSSDSKEKAEALLVAYAKAYGALAEPEQLLLWKKRRQASRDAARAPKKDTAAQTFKISTTLLDARSQFAEAKKRLEAGNARGAMEYFEYACDIEAKPEYRSHLAWARFLVSPLHAKLALTELGDIAKNEPECESAHFFLGEIHRSQKNAALAEEAYRRAFKVNPQNRKAIELAQEMAKAKR
jgi:tetratricopeptide (TPR) repeat protein